MAKGIAAPSAFLDDADHGRAGDAVWHLSTGANNRRNSNHLDDAAFA
jgi:hypothetical protein